MSTPKFQNRYRIPSARYEHHDYDGGQTGGQAGGQTGGQTSSQTGGQTWKGIERQMK